MTRFLFAALLAAGAFAQPAGKIRLPVSGDDGVRRCRSTKEHR